MALITLTSPTFQQVITARALTDTNLGTAQTLDLRAKFGAILHVCIGRIVTDALTRPGYVAIRPEFFDGTNSQMFPSRIYDAISTVAAATGSTQSGAHNDASLLLVNAAGLNPNDIMCRADATPANNTALSRVEFFEVARISSNTLTPTWDFIGADGNSGDTCLNQADIFRIWIPGGDRYRIRPVNNSGRTLIFKVDAIIYDSETIT